MKVPQPLITTIAAMFLSGSISTAMAEPAPHDHASMHHNMTMQVAENQMTHEGHGVLKAINIRDGKVQIAHEAIAALHWPAMTMWFTLRAPLPTGLKAGDEVRFELMQADGKSWQITKIEVRQ